MLVRVTMDARSSGNRTGNFRALNREFSVRSREQPDADQVSAPHPYATGQAKHIMLSPI
jgi:hypothetical protein